MAILFLLGLGQIPFLKLNCLECNIVVYEWTYFVFCLPLKEFVFRFSINQLLTNGHLRCKLITLLDILCVIALDVSFM